MRFLYGDSAPFPHRFNVLTTLDRFVTAGARVVELEIEARRMTMAAAAAAQERTRSLGVLDEFHEAMARAISEAGSRNKEPRTQEYATELVAHAVRLMEAARRNVEDANE